MADAAPNYPTALLDFLKAFEDSVAEKAARRVAELYAERVSAPPASFDSLLSAEEACKRLGIARTTLYQLRRKGHLETVLLGSVQRFRAEDVERLIREGTPQ